MARKRLATGIYQDASGVMIRVPGKPPADYRRDADGVRYEQQYKDRGLSWLRDERKRLLASATVAVESKAESDALFAADVTRFLATIGSKGHRVNTAGYMAHWELHFRERHRNNITDIEAQTAFASIEQAASTRIHIRRALIKFYEALNGKSGYNPGRSIQKPAKDEEQVRDLPWRDIESMFAAMQPSKAKARLMLIAYAGLPQKQIRALQPADLRLDRRELVVHPRRKGAGVRGVTQPLSDYAVAALKEFARLNAFGSFQNVQLVRAFNSAVKRAGVTLPAWARPYDLRHSFLTEVARGGADIRDIAQLGMHATLEQAARYTRGVAAERATKALASVPRFSATTNRRNLPVRSSSVARVSAARGVGKGRKQGQKPQRHRG